MIYYQVKFKKKKFIPEFLKRERSKEEERKIKELIKNGEIKASDNYHAEKFFIDVELFIKSGELREIECYVIFDPENNNEFKQITKIQSFNMFHYFLSVPMSMAGRM